MAICTWDSLFALCVEMSHSAVRAYYTTRPRMHVSSFTPFQQIQFICIIANNALLFSSSSCHMIVSVTQTIQQMQCMCQCQCHNHLLCCAFRNFFYFILLQTHWLACMHECLHSWCVNVGVDVYVCKDEILVIHKMVIDDRWLCACMYKNMASNWIEYDSNVKFINGIGCTLYTVHTYTMHASMQKKHNVMNRNHIWQCAERGKRDFEWFDSRMCCALSGRGAGTVIEIYVNLANGVYYPRLNRIAIGADYRNHLPKI